MKLKLKESIRCNGVQHRPPAVIDTEALGISDAEAAVLVRRGVAVHFEEAAAPAPAPADAPEVTNLALGDVEGELAGVADADGKVTPLEDMTKAELLALAKDMEIEGADGLKKAELVAAIKAQKVIVPAADGDKDGEDQGQE